MKKSNKTLIIIVLLSGFILTLLVGVIAFVFIGPGGEYLGLEPKYWTECSIDVRQSGGEIIISPLPPYILPLGGDELKIESATCSKTTDVCGYAYAFFPINGQLEMFDSVDKIGAAELSVDYMFGQFFKIRGCTSENMITIKIYSEDGNTVYDTWSGTNE